MIINKFRRIPNSEKRILTLTALIGLWCIFLWNAFGSDRSFALWMDNEFMIGTILSSMSTSLSNGEWPLRMDTILAGFPLYNLTQLSSLYPFYFTALPIYKDPLDVVHSMHWLTLVHLLILEINMYLFIRVIGASRLAALTGAALVAFSANSVVYASWVNIIAPYSWLALYLAGMVGILKAPTSKAYFAMALGGIVLLTLASPSQPLIHAVFLTIIFVFAYWRYLLRIGKVKQLRYSLGRLAEVAVLALLLTAPVILPAAIEYKNMIRWVGPFPPVVGNSRISFAAFTFDQLAIADLAGVFFKFKSAAVGNPFVGILPVALASIAVISRPRSWLVAALAFITVYSLISSTGSNLGLAYLNYILPLLNKIREPSRFLVLFLLAINVLAALGIDELRKIVSGTETEVNSKRQVIAFAVIAMIAVITLLVVRERIVSHLFPAISLAIFVALTFMTWLVAQRKFRNRGSLVALAWGGAAIILLTIEVSWTPPPVSSSKYLNSGALALDMAIDRVAKLDPDRQYRVLFDGKIEKPMAAMLASYRDVRTFNSFVCPAPLHQFEEIYYHAPRADNYFRILGAKYLICRECSEESLRGYKHLETLAGYEIYESQDVLPHSYIVHRLNGTFLNLADFAVKAASAELSKGLLFVEPNTAIGVNKLSNATDADCISREDIRTINRSRFVVQCKSAGVLIMNEFFDEAWRITVDGVTKQTLKVNGNQMGVPFKPGSHVIEFRYTPGIYLFSLLLMFIGIVLIIHLWMRSKRATEFK